MRCKGNCRDNVAVARFFSTLKTKLVHERDFSMCEPAKADLFEFIEVFYRKRCHSALGYVRPVEYES